MRRDDNRIVTGLKNEQSYEEAENCNKYTRKERSPESGYFEAGDKGRNQKHHQRIDQEQEKSEGKERQRNGQQDDNRTDDGIGQAQQER